MALINCPECGKEISDKATVCPNCGYPIGDRTQQDETQPIQKKKSKMTIAIIAIILVVGIGTIITIIILNSGPSLSKAVSAAKNNGIPESSISDVWYCSEKNGYVIKYRNLSKNTYATLDVEKNIFATEKQWEKDIDCGFRPDWAAEAPLVELGYNKGGNWERLK